MKGISFFTVARTELVKPNEENKSKQDRTMGKGPWFVWEVLAFCRRKFACPLWDSESNNKIKAKFSREKEGVGGARGC